MAGAALVLGLAGCKDDLTVPGGCPDLCLGEPAVVDVTIPVTQGSDSTHVGYTGLVDVSALLVSDGLPAGEARAWYRFPSRADTVQVDGVWMPYTIDSVAFSVPLVVRDSMVTGLVLYVYRVGRTIDTLITFTDLEAALTPGSIIDSIMVPDTTRSGTLPLVLTGEALDRVAIPPDDSGRIAIGLRMRANAPSGARLGAILGTAGPASFTTYARVAVTDTARQRQTISLTAEGNGFVLDASRTIDPDLLYLGGFPGTRSILRFDISSLIPDSATLIRATLELEPAEVFHGLPNDDARVTARGVRVDIGAKSSPVISLGESAVLPEGKDATVGIELLGLASFWRGPNAFPALVYLTLSPETGSFHRPVFRSSRSPTGAPRLQVTYFLPAPVDRP